MRLPWGEFREQHPLQEGEEDGGRGGGLDGHRGDQPVEAERAQERDLAPPARYRAAGPLASRRAGVAAGHGGRDAARVEGDQPGGIGRGGVLAVGGTLLDHVLAVPLAGPQGLFLRPSLSSTLHGQGGRQATSRRRSRRPAGIFAPSGSDRAVAKASARQSSALTAARASLRVGVRFGY